MPVELKLASNNVVPLQFGYVFLEGLRPWAYTASVVPMLLAIALAWPAGTVSLFSAAGILLSGLLVHSGVNLFNYYYDPRVVRAANRSPIWARARAQIFTAACGFYGLAFIVGLYFALKSGVMVMIIGLVGLAGGYFYSAPPIWYQKRGVAFLLVFVLMGPLMVYGAYYALIGSGSWHVIWVSLPVGALVSLILISDEMRDVESDALNGIRTFTVRTGYEVAKKAYAFLVVMAYGATAALIAVNILPLGALLTFLSFPVLREAVKLIEADARKRPLLTTATAKIHFVFGILLIVSVLVW